MPHQQACTHIRTALANIRLAIQICGSADLTRLQQALALLEASRSEMHRAEASVLSAKQEESAELQRESALLKREIACLMRVIDGCAALHRGLGVRLGCPGLTDSAQAYSAQGRSVAASPPTAACEMQG